MFRVELPAPYLLFLADVANPNLAKTAHGLAYWAPDRCSAQWRLPGCAAETGLPERTPAEAVREGARALVIGVAPGGGRIPERWVASLVDALEAGLDLVSGMHVPLAGVPAIAEAASRCGRSLYDVRLPRETFEPATGRPRSGLRCLTVGLDCALGKKFTALAVTQALRARGVRATFRATGQTGILIAGEGIAIDAVTADFVAGAAETLSPDNDADHWDVVEGQGSLYHAAYAGVTLGLMHGTQPDALVLCGHATRTHLELAPHIPLRSYEDAIATHEHLAAVTNPHARVVAVSVNTAEVGGEDAARSFCGALAERLGLPVTDPVRFGAEAIAGALESLASSGVRAVS